VHPPLVIEVFYGFLTYLQEIGLKGKKGKLNNYSSHFWPCALPLTDLSGIYEKEKENDAKYFGKKKK
jgi:hypothetical protein